MTLDSIILGTNHLRITRVVPFCRGPPRASCPPNRKTCCISRLGRNTGVKTHSKPSKQDFHRVIPRVSLTPTSPYLCHWKALALLFHLLQATKPPDKDKGLFTRHFLLSSTVHARARSVTGFLIAHECMIRFLCNLAQ